MIKEVESSVGLTVFFDEGASQKQMDSIGEAIKSREEVDHIEFVSAEQAWKEFAAENFKDNPDLVDSFAGDNPLADSASYQVYVKDISKQDELASYIREIAGVRLVKQSTISTGITVRRAEIGIMRLMGASDFFIRAPFIVEGVVIGLIGAVIPLVILLVSYSSIIQYIKTKFDMISSWMTFLPVGTIFKALIPLCLLIGIGVGFIGSFFTVRKHLDI